MPCLITMSQKELHRLEVIQKIRDERLSVVQAAELLNPSRSQIHRLLQAYDQDGPTGLVSKKRSRPSNRRHSEDFRNAALDLIREHVARDLMLFQTMLRGSSAIEEMAENYPFSEHAVFERPGAPRLFFVEHRFAGDPTNWWIPNAACAEAMLRSAGFEILQRPEEEVWLCGRGERPEWSGAVYPAVGGR